MTSGNDSANRRIEDIIGSDDFSVAGRTIDGEPYQASYVRLGFGPPAGHPNAVTPDELHYVDSAEEADEIIAKYLTDINDDVHDGTYIIEIMIQHPKDNANDDSHVADATILLNQETGSEDTHSAPVTTDQRRVKHKYLRGVLPVTLFLTGFIVGGLLGVWTAVLIYVAAYTGVAAIRRLRPRNSSRHINTVT